LRSRRWASQRFFASSQVTSFFENPKSSQIIADSKKFQVKSRAKISQVKSSHTKIDRLGSYMTNENWKRLSIYPNPFFISRLAEVPGVAREISILLG
jgi:hypothetical protein